MPSLSFDLSHNYRDYLDTWFFETNDHIGYLHGLKENTGIAMAHHSLLMQCDLHDRDGFF